MRPALTPTRGLIPFIITIVAGCALGAAQNAPPAAQPAPQPGAAAATPPAGAPGAPAGGPGAGTPAGAAAKPQAIPAVPQADGSYRDLKGQKLIPPAVMLGAKLEPCPPSIAKHLKLDASKCSVMDNVIDGLPVQKAGFETHDVIIAVEGLPDASVTTIRSHIREMKPGDQVVVTARRGNETVKGTIIAVPWKAEHMVRPLRHDSVTLPPVLLPPTPPPLATMDQVKALQARIDAMEKEIAELRKEMQKK